MASIYKEKAVSALRKAGDWIYGLASGKNWKSWVLLAAAAALCILMWMLALDNVDYQSDPSALVPRSAFFYGETTDVRTLLGNASARQIWAAAPREQTAEGQWSRLEMDVADIISGHVNGLARMQPLMWIAGSSKAAVAFLAGEDGVESWALYLDCGKNGAVALDQIKVERDLELEKAESDKHKGEVYKLTSVGGEGALYVCHVDPWLIIASGDTLPKFAVSRDSGFSLAKSRILPEWRYNSSLRGVFNPSYLAVAGSEQGSRFALLGQWLSPDARIGFTGNLPASGDFTLRYSTATLAATPGGDGLWPLFKILFGLLGVVLVVLLISIAAIMLGWGTWLKILAVKAGIAPSGAPKRAAASAAFRQDSGADAIASRDEVIAVETAAVAEPAVVADTTATESAAGPENEDGEEASGT